MIIDNDATWGCQSTVFFLLMSFSASRTYVLFLMKIGNILKFNCGSAAWDVADDARTLGPISYLSNSVRSSMLQHRRAGATFHVCPRLYRCQVQSSTQSYSYRSLELVVQRAEHPFSTTAGLVRYSMDDTSTGNADEQHFRQAAKTYRSYWQGLLRSCEKRCPSLTSPKFNLSSLFPTHTLASLIR